MRALGIEPWTSGCIASAFSPWAILQPVVRFWLLSCWTATESIAYRILTEPVGPCKINPRADEKTFQVQVLVLSAWWPDFILFSLIELCVCVCVYEWIFCLYAWCLCGEKRWKWSYWWSLVTMWVWEPKLCKSSSALSYCVASPASITLWSPHESRRELAPQSLPAFTCSAGHMLPQHNK